MHPVDADFDEPYYLGRIRCPCLSEGCQSDRSHLMIPTQDTRGANSQNPFVASGLVGAEAAKGGFFLAVVVSVNPSTIPPWAYLMCLFSLVPHAMYGYGLNRELLATKLGRFPCS